jgi:hypothetical protein
LDAFDLQAVQVLHFEIGVSSIIKPMEEVHSLIYAILHWVTLIKVSLKCIIVPVFVRYNALETALSRTFAADFSPPT